MSKIFVTKAPEDPKEHDITKFTIVRIQLAMYVDDKATCEYCGYTYKSVDDFIRCNPRNGIGNKKSITFVCSGCWINYKKEVKQNSS